MSDRMTNQRGHDAGDKDPGERNRPDTGPNPPHQEDERKSGLHQTGADPLKQIPATEGGEA
jgi:hypothetical protein